MELLQLQYFVKVARAGSITRAAKEMYISQPALSTTIARLESCLLYTSWSWSAAWVPSTYNLRTVYRREEQYYMEANKRLYRSNRNKMICGVCGGIAEYFNIDPTIVRLGFAILAFSWKGLLIYFLAAIIIPMEPM